MSDGETRQVQIRNGQIRATPSFLGKIVARVEYGDRLTIGEEQAGWRRVALTSLAGEGWIHDSALTTKKIILAADDADLRQAAESDEIALAGKGFNQEVEQEFRSRNKQLDFSWLDRMESRWPPQAEKIREFLQQGGLPQLSATVPDSSTGTGTSAKLAGGAQ